MADWKDHVNEAQTHLDKLSEHPHQNIPVSEIVAILGLVLRAVQAAIEATRKGPKDPKPPDAPKAPETPPAS